MLPTVTQGPRSQAATAEQQVRCCSLRSVWAACAILAHTHRGLSSLARQTLEGLPPLIVTLLRL